MKEKTISNSIIISTTAYNELEEINKCLKAGADNVLNKPITLSQLFKAINNPINSSFQKN